MKQINGVLLVVGLFCCTTCIWASEGLWQENGKVICNAANNQDALRMIADGRGGAILIWQDLRSGINTVYALRIDSTGVLQGPSNGSYLSYSIGRQENPQLSTDGYGGAIIAWQDYRAGNRDPLGGVPLYDVYAQRISNTGVSQWGWEAKFVGHAKWDSYPPQLVSDGTGGAIIAWQNSWCAPHGGSGVNVRVQHVDSNGNSLWAEVMLGGYSQAAPALIPDGNKGAIIAWTGGDQYHLDIYAQRLNSQGNIQWAPGGTRICAALGAQGNPKLIPYSNSGALLVWSGSRGSSNDIWAQRIDGLGKVQWVENGMSVCNADDEQINPQVVSDGSGGAIIVWQDNRNGSTSDIFAQRINSAGVSQWASNGVAICTAPGNQEFPQVSSDNKGGYIFVWRDWRNSANPDIYAQRVNGTGTCQWVTDGVPICNAGNSQFEPQILPFNNGGAIIAWGDSRTGLSDIYAQYVIKPKPELVSITTPGIQGYNFHATITGNYFKDDLGAVTYAKLTRTSFANIVATNIVPAITGESLTCDFNLTSAAVGNWGVVLIDSLGQTSTGSVSLMVVQATPTSTTTPTVTLTSTITTTETVTRTYTATPSLTMTPTISCTPTESLTATPSPTNMQTNTPSPTITVSPTITPTVTLTATPADTPIPDSEKRLRVWHSQINPNHNERAKIRWYQNDSSPVQIKVYNQLGNEIATLADCKGFMPDQINEVLWDGTNRHGVKVGSGIYLVYYSSGGHKEWTKVAVVK